MTLMEKASSLREAEQQSEREYMAELRKQYYELLARQENPQPKDVEELLNLVSELKISDCQARDDAVLVAKFQRLTTEASQYETLQASVIEVRATLFAFEKETTQKVRDAKFELAKIENRAGDAHLAQAELKTLQRQRPDLFDTSPGPKNGQ